MDDFDEEVFLTEVWNENDAFLHTALTARCGTELRYGEVQDRGSAEDLRVKVHLHVVPKEEIYPLQPGDVQICSKVDKDQIFVKRPNCRAYGQVRGSDTLANEFLAEIRIYERLATCPHSNLPRYHGCLVEDGRLVEIALDRYAGTLAQRHEVMDRVSRIKCFLSVQAGIKHLHAVGLVHNDINPMNIMFEENGNTVVTDFDSCEPDGAPLVKTGTPGWNDGFATWSPFANDLRALERLRGYLGLPEPTLDGSGHIRCTG